MNPYPRLALVIAVILAALFCAYHAIAQEVVTTPVVVAPAPNTVAIPIGAWINDALMVLLAGLGTIVAWAFRWLPARWNAILMTAQADQLLTKAIAYGINAVAGAAKDKTLSIEVSNRVLREAVTYAIVHGSDAVKEFLGTPEDIAEKVFARLSAAPEVVKPDIEGIAIAASNNAAKTLADREAAAA